MAEALPFPQLSLNLPSSRMSVDFSTIATDFSTISTSYSTSYNVPRAKPQPPLHRVSPQRTYNHGPSLPEVKEEPDRISTAPPRQSSMRWPWRKSSERPAQPIAPLSRTASNASTASTASTAMSSVFSNAQSGSSRTSYTSTRHSRRLSSFSKEVPCLSTLPLSLLEQILSYALSLPLTVSIGPEKSDNRHLQHRYHRAGLDYVDLQQMLKHPLFFVSHHVRNVSLDIFYRKADFVIDLHKIYHTKVSSTIDENMKTHQKFWMYKTPKMVHDSLRSLSKLHIRLPVPSTEAGVRKGRDEDDWMDGSDGKGGGSWKVKSMKREQEDALEIQKFLEAIRELVMPDKGNEPESRPLARSRSSASVRRTTSVRNARSKSAEYSNPWRRVNHDIDDEGGKRKSLKRLEVVFVKRSPWAMVLPESLNLVRTLRSVPVTGFTKYYFELSGQKIIWATKYRKTWQGMEPDGTRLLNDLQGLTVAETPIEPIKTPTEFKFVKVDRRGQLRLLDSALPKTPIVLEPPKVPEKDLPEVPPLPSLVKSSGRRKPITWARKKPKRRDSFALIMEEGISEVGNTGTVTSGRNNPPTIDELKKIAEDIRNGLY